MCGGRGGRLLRMRMGASGRSLSCGHEGMYYRLVYNIKNESRKNYPLRTESYLRRYPTRWPLLLSLKGSPFRSLGNTDVLSHIYPGITAIAYLEYHLTVQTSLSYSNMDSQSPNDPMDLDHGEGSPGPLQDIAEQSPSSQVQDLEEAAVSSLTSAASDIRFTSKSPTPSPPPGLLEELAELQGE
jgi:hypothetical protein